MSYSIESYNVDLYNRLFKGSRYDTRMSSDHEYKFAFIEKFVDKVPNGHMIFDIGSGRGFNTFNLLNKGKKVVAVDFSDVLDTYNSHSNLLTYKMEILDFLNETNKENYKYKSAVLCTGMLEHVIPEYIDDVLKGLSKLSSKAFYGISNHSDRAEGYELHLIRESSDWWMDLMNKYYKNINLVSTKYKDRFFFISCSEPKKKK